MRDDMSKFDETADLIEWLRQPRWMEGAKQRRLFDAADEIERLRAELSRASKADNAEDRT